MRTTETTNPTLAPVHHQQHVESMNKWQATMYGALLCAGGFFVLAIAVGLDRTQGSDYIYGFSRYIWPIIALVPTGAVMGGLLGALFGYVTLSADPEHAPPTSDPAEEDVVVTPRLQLHPNSR